MLHAVCLSFPQEPNQGNKWLDKGILGMSFLNYGYINGGSDGIILTFDDHLFGSSGLEGNLICFEGKGLNSLSSEPG